MRFAFRWAVVAVSLLAGGASVRAEPRATLEVSRGPGAERCADARLLMEEVEARLGGGIFAPAGEPDGAGPARVVSVQFSRRGLGYVAEVRLSEAGVARGLRRLETTRTARVRCADLTESVALAVALAIDPLGELAARRPPDEPTATASAMRRPAEPEARIALTRAPPELGPETRPGESAPDWAWTLELGVGAVLGLAPSAPALGPGFGVRATSGTWSLGVEGVARFASARLGDEAVAVATRAFGAIARVGWRGTSGWGLDAELAVHAWGASGPGGDGVRVHLAPGLGVSWRARPGELFASLAMPLGRQRLTLDGVELWRMPAWLLTLGVRVDLDGSTTAAPIPLR